ncbi:MAG: hypothetical protein WDN28_06115 [Chthoniobacter sp.]
MAPSQKTSVNYLGAVATGILILGLFAIGLFFVYRHEMKETRQAETVQISRETEADFQAARRILFSVAESCIADQEFSQTVPLDDRFDAAFAATAKNTHTALPELHRQTDAFATWVQGNSAATPGDRALSDFTRRKFGEAATGARKAAEAFHNLRRGEETNAETALHRSSTAGGRLKVRLTAKADEAAAKERALAAQGEECTAWILAGHIECLGKQTQGGGRVVPKRAGFAG